MIILTLLVQRESQSFLQQVILSMVRGGWQRASCITTGNYLHSGLFIVNVYMTDFCSITQLYIEVNLLVVKTGFVGELPYTW